MRRKGIAIVLVTFALLSVLLVVSLSALIDKNRERIRDEIRKGLGRSFTSEQLRLSLWGGVGLSAKNLRIAEDPQFAATPFIQTKELRIQFRLLPLFSGRIEIKRFVLDEPEIQIVRNETGKFNLSTLGGPEKAAAETREVQQREEKSDWQFLLSALQVTKGKLDYIDRSQKEPVEIRVRNLHVDVHGASLSGTAKIKLAASLTEGQGQHIKVEGHVGPIQNQSNWTRYPVDLQLHTDSLPVVRLVRAVPFLRDRIFLDLGVTGPVAAETRLLGTFERPRISNLKLTGPFFGATEDNATVLGELDLSEGSSWAEGKIKGTLTLQPLSLNDLKKSRLLAPFLPAALSSQGPMSLRSEISGSLTEFRIRASIKGQDSEILYGDWLHKAKGIPAEIELKALRHRDRIIFEDSALTIHNTKLKFSGALEQRPEGRLMLRVSPGRANLSGWDNLLPPVSSYSAAGELQWDLSIQKNFGLKDEGLDIRGALNLSNTQFKDKRTGRGLEKGSAQLSLRGKEGRIESAEGIWDEMPFRNLKGDFAWTSKELRFNNLTFQALGGSFRGGGNWGLGAGDSQRIAFDSSIEAMDFKTLLTQRSPKFKDHIEGRLHFSGRLRAESKDGSSFQESLQGEGETNVKSGSLRDFNLVERVLSSVTGLPGVPNLLPSHLPARYSDLLKRKDTPFDTLRASFVMERERIRTEDFLLATPDYSIHGKGWFGFDKSMKWAATLVMSSRFTQELMQEHKNVRYMLDRQGRLAVPFRLEGTLPHVQPKPDLQGLAEAIQRGLLRKGAERFIEGDKGQKTRERRDWIQKGLEQLFRR